MKPGILQSFKVIVVLLLAANSVMLAHAGSLKHKLFHLQGEEPGNTVLVVGGIQGDEPGGFTAASILVTDYKIKKGNLWVIPNLNFESIVQSSRGLYGDMNRKFRTIKTNDPDYDAVEEVKRLIRDRHVDLVLNLHDGSGYYRKQYVDSRRNPYRWGQSIVIDQNYLAGSQFPQLGNMAKHVADVVNRRFHNKDFWYNIRNTRTSEGDYEMQQTLTYYAVKQKKAAFGIEASKTYPTHARVFFHLNLIEEFLKLAGIKFQRDFQLTMPELHKMIGRNLALTLYKKKISLHLDDVQHDIRYFPLKRDSKLEFTTNNPLLVVIKSKGYYKVKYGNRNIIKLYPQYFDYDDSLREVVLNIDGISNSVAIGTTVNVRRNFSVKAREDYRVNVIGFVCKKPSEDGIEITKTQMLKRYSLDDRHDIYRVEFYKGKKFAGMILVRFHS